MPQLSTWLAHDKMVSLNNHIRERGGGQKPILYVTKKKLGVLSLKAYW